MIHVNNLQINQPLKEDKKALDKDAKKDGLKGFKTPPKQLEKTPDLENIDIKLKFKNLAAKILSTIDPKNMHKQSALRPSPKLSISANVANDLFIMLESLKDKPGFEKIIKKLKIIDIKGSKTLEKLDLNYAKNLLNTPDNKLDAKQLEEKTKLLDLVQKNGGNTEKSLEKAVKILKQDALGDFFKNSGVFFESKLKNALIKESLPKEFYKLFSAIKGLNNEVLSDDIKTLGELGLPLKESFVKLQSILKHHDTILKPLLEDSSFKALFKLGRDLENAKTYLLVNKNIKQKKLIKIANVLEKKLEKMAKEVNKEINRPQNIAINDTSVLRRLNDALRDFAKNLAEVKNKTNVQSNKQEINKDTQASLVKDTKPLKDGGTKIIVLNKQEISIKEEAAKNSPNINQTNQEEAIKINKEASKNINQEKATKDIKAIKEENISNSTKNITKALEDKTLAKVSENENEALLKSEAKNNPPLPIKGQNKEAMIKSEENLKKNLDLLAKNLASLNDLTTLRKPRKNAREINLTQKDISLAANTLRKGLEAAKTPSQKAAIIEANIKELANIKGSNQNAKMSEKKLSLSLSLLKQISKELQSLKQASKQEIKNTILPKMLNLSFNEDEDSKLLEKLFTSISKTSIRVKDALNALDEDAVAASFKHQDIKRLQKDVQAAYDAIDKMGEKSSKEIAKALQDDLKPTLQQAANIAKELKDENVLNQANKLLAQIELNQLLSLANSTISTFLPFYWDEMSGQNVVFKRGKKDKYFASINLEFKTLGKLNVLLSLQNEKYLDINMMIEDEDFRKKLYKNAGLLKVALSKVGIKPFNFFISSMPKSELEFSCVYDDLSVDLNKVV